MYESLQSVPPSCREFEEEELGSLLAADGRGKGRLVFEGPPMPLVQLRQLACQCHFGI